MNLWVNRCATVDGRQLVGDYWSVATVKTPQRGMTGPRRWTRKPAMTTGYHPSSTIHMGYYYPCKNFSLVGKDLCEVPL